MRRNKDRASRKSDATSLAVWAAPSGSTFDIAPSLTRHAADMGYGPAVASESAQLVPSPAPGGLPRSVARLRALEEVARGYATASKAPNTIRAYRRDLVDFEDFCRDAGFAPLPASPETVALYLAHLAEAGAKASTIQRRLSAVSQAHQLAGHVPSPTQDWMVRATMSGIRRTIRPASVSPPSAPALESSSPRTSDSRACTDSSSGPRRTPRSIAHRRRRLPDWP